MNTINEKVKREVIGLIPAAGEAKRMAPLPCSKELYPIGFEIEENSNLPRPKSVCHYLIEKMKNVGVSKIYFVLRKGKWDIPSYLGDGAKYGMHFAYLIMGISFGVPYTLDQAYPFIKQKTVVLGFPDIMFEGNDAFQQLIGKTESGKNDLVLGLFPSDRPEKADLVVFDRKGTVRKIIMKDNRTRLRYTWGIAAWTPVFTNYLHDKLRNFEARTFIGSELLLNHIINLAVQDGLRVGAVHVSDKPFIDIGTPEDLAAAARRYMRLSNLSD